MRQETETVRHMYGVCSVQVRQKKRHAYRFSFRREEGENQTRWRRVAEFHFVPMGCGDLVFENDVSVFFFLLAAGRDIKEGVY